MSQIIVSYRNILENSTVTPLTEDASFPKTRMYDRDIGKLFKGTAFANPFGIFINQSPIYEADRLIIPVGHNFNGLNMELLYGIDGINWTTATSWTQGDDLIIDKSFSAQTKQYWYIAIYAPATIVELPELYLTKDVVFLRNPAMGSMVGTKKNIVSDQTQSGLSRKVKLGELKRLRRYDLNYITATQKTDFEAWDALCEGVKSFYIHDYDNSCIFMELLSDLEFTASGINRWTCMLELTEVLA
jgi:hypothetical protein